MATQPRPKILKWSYFTLYICRLSSSYHILSVCYILRYVWGYMEWILKMDGSIDMRVFIWNLLQILLYMYSYCLNFKVLFVVFFGSNKSIYPFEKENQFIRIFKILNILVLFGLFMSYRVSIQKKWITTDWKSFLLRTTMLCYENSLFNIF